MNIYDHAVRGPWEEEMERRIDDVVELVIEKMKENTVAMFPPPPNPKNIPRGLILASIMWARLGHKLLKKLDDVRHEYLLAMRQCTGE